MFFISINSLRQVISPKFGDLLKTIEIITNIINKDNIKYNLNLKLSMN